MANFSDCNANIYDDSGEYLANVRIESYDKKENTIEVSDMPDSVSGACEVVILSAPLPFAYKGVIRRIGAATFITLYEGHTREQRSSVRYKTDLPGVIEHLLFDDKRYKLHTPLKMRIVNVSKKGLRLSGKSNDLIKSLCPGIRINVGKGEQVLLANIVNSRLRPDGIEEYGCALYKPKSISDKKVSAAVNTPVEL